MNNITTGKVLNPQDITCPDEVIQSWLDDYHKCEPSGSFTLKDLGDLPLDMIYRAVDYGANQELSKVLSTMLKIIPDCNYIITRLWLKRRPAAMNTNKKMLLEKLDRLKKMIEAT